ncbi:probable carboxylesterase 15 [Olea europaea var. sylvestris]|uniref:probable carboxylesterase 15 n=1 Tax=Olea europaea var. sylvestris TaxID=158386 RepID=UPI000C1D0EF6|nr:probable carboxylesterase 15 [Olea europaea var. sylvestris]XP_022842783.1 probable carboxylesterase 15 [Olea europaea var. sylvestris]
MGSLPHVVEDHLGILQILSNGSIFRIEEKDIIFPMKVHDDGSVNWKDCLYDKKHDLHLRLYKPWSAPNPTTKLPIVFFLHGGGFIVGSRTWPNCHNCCLRLASGLQALVVAPDYRLAPEHRLPAAVDDALNSVKWLQNEILEENNSDAWLKDGVDFGRVFIVGDSSGGNLAHHLAVKLGPGSPELAPIRLRGYVLFAPFFGGIVRTKSEAEGLPEPFLNLDILDRFWRLSLPDGSTRDHPFANPFGPLSPSLESIKLDPMLVILGGSELMKDRIEDYVKKLKEEGKKIHCVVFQGKQHGFFTNEPFSEVGDKVLQELKNFITRNSDD